MLRAASKTVGRARRSGWSSGRSAAPPARPRCTRADVVARDVDAARDRIGAAGLVGGVDERLQALVAGDRDLLRVGEAGRVGRRRSSASAGARRSRRRRSTAGRGTCSAMSTPSNRPGMRRRAAAAVRRRPSAGADGERRHAERLDEVLLAHHRRFAREHRVAVVGRVLQRVDEHPVAFAEPLEVSRVKSNPASEVALRRALDVPAAGAAEAVDGDQPPVPAARRRERRRRRHPSSDRAGPRSGRCRGSSCRSRPGRRTARSRRRSWWSIAHVGRQRRSCSASASARRRRWRDRGSARGSRPSSWRRARGPRLLPSGSDEGSVWQMNGVWCGPENTGPVIG